ncbi:transcriptional regulatory protein rco1 [Friedmanniomyces endolithicus]|nr:transcriptional regulatory protein rco1 [Friedmanniomyces endolithicus]
MAHIHDLAPRIAHYHAGVRNQNTQLKFPNTDVFNGFNAPSRLEGEITDLEVDGTIPPEINGTFYRIQPDHRYPPKFEDDLQFNGDGAVTAIRIQKGHADFKQRYVRTERYEAETAERRALFGRYRNLYTDDELVKGVIRTASNTNVVFWRGMLLAMKEDGPPFALDPVTLETVGRYDFEGQVQSPTFTAHPKFDPVTGEMVCFGYEAGGNGNDASNDIVVYTINADGVKTEECWYKSPFCGMIHDCGISENYLVMPLTPLKCSLDRLKRGGNHWAWDPNEDQWYGVVPRRGGKPDDIKWFRSANAFHGHTAGCYETAEGSIVYDLTVADGNVFFFFPPDDMPPGSVPQRNKLKSETCRWVLDPAAPTGTYVTPERSWNTSGEFSRIDDRLVTKRYDHFWQCKIDPAREYDCASCGPPAGGLFNCLGHYKWSDQTEDVYWAGPRATFQEPTFIPAGSGEGEGWLIALVNQLDVLRNDIMIFDALKLSAGPVATVRLPFKLKLGLHGNFVDHADIAEWQARRRQAGGIGPVKAAERPLPWQLAMNNGTSNGHTEHNGGNGLSSH